MVVCSKRSDPMRSAFIEGILGMGFVLVVALTVVIVLRSFTNKLLEVDPLLVLSSFDLILFSTVLCCLLTTRITAWTMQQKSGMKYLKQQAVNLSHKASTMHRDPNMAE